MIKISTKQFTWLLTLLALVLSNLVTVNASSASSGSAIYQEIPLTFTGGFEIGTKDYGRPVLLIASMLHVSPSVFRQAFSGVTPARNGGPSTKQTRTNKAALLSVLAPYGVTNEMMDTVANYYRFNRSKGETWPQTKASGVAIVENGQVIDFKITNAGSGYNSVPTITIPGFPNVKAVANVTYTAVFRTNGHISAITLAE